MSVIDQFGIEGKLLLTQLINFLILAVVMWKWVLPKVTQLMDERKRSIADSLKEAEKARKEAAQADTDREALLAQTKREAEAIMDEARTAAKAEGEKILQQTRAESTALTERTKQQLKAERDKMQTELRAELAGLTVEATRQVLSRVTTAEDREKMAKQALGQLKKSGAKRGR